MGDLSDSEETPVVWPKELPELKHIDDRLRCPICYNYMKNPVITTTCSHNFCSLCIRKNISLKNSCPICFLEISDGVLRPNRSLEEIIKCFQPVKNYVLAPTNKRGQSYGEILENNLLSHSKEDSRNDSILPGKSSDPPSPSDHHQLHASKIANGHATSKLISEECLKTIVPSTPEVHQKQSQMSYSTPHSSSASRPFVQPRSTASSSQAGKEVACPVCKIYMREAMINIHLDSCLNKDKTEKRKPLPKLIYSFMKETELRKRLRDLELSSSGDKTTLINRLRRYTIFYNSECDAAEPRPIEELRAQFEEEEAENRRLATEFRQEFSKNKSTDVVEKENIQYIRNNKESYDRLINDIRQRQAVKTETTPREEDNLPLNEEVIAGPSQVESVPRKETNDSEDEVTVLVVPPKVYETISLSDSSDCDASEPPARGPTATFTTTNLSATSSSDEGPSNSGTSSSNCSIPDPAESNDSSSSNEVQSVLLLSTESSSGSSLSPSYSPTEGARSSFHFFSESSNSSSPQPAPQSQVGKKRTKSPLKASSERRMSLRRRM